MTYEDTDGAFVSIKRARAECKTHGAIAELVDHGTALLIVDGHSVHSTDVWGKVRVYEDGTVSARAVLSVLGY